MVSLFSFLRSTTRCRSNAQRSALRVLSTVLLITASIGLLAGCSGSATPIFVAGEWEVDSSYEFPEGNEVTNIERWSISDSTIEYGTYDGSTYTVTFRADIVTYSNYRLNAGDSALIAGRESTTNPGYAVIQYTEVNNAGTGEVGKYNIFRWAENNDDPTLRDFTQGSKDATPDDSDNYVNDVFDTAAAAEAGATVENGYFAFASTGASSQ